MLCCQSSLQQQAWMQRGSFVSPQQHFLFVIISLLVRCTYTRLLFLLLLSCFFLSVSFKHPAELTVACRCFLSKNNRDCWTQDKHMRFRNSHFPHIPETHHSHSNAWEQAVTFLSGRLHRLLSASRWNDYSFFQQVQQRALQIGSAVDRWVCLMDGGDSFSDTYRAPVSCV